MESKRKCVFVCLRENNNVSGKEIGGKVLVCERGRKCVLKGKSGRGRKYVLDGKRGKKCACRCV
jgi:hypothetical protein